MASAQPKVKGNPIIEFDGIKIYRQLHEAKKTGKNRIWIQIRQDEPKRFRVARTLAYARGLDVQFEEDKPKP